MTHISEAPTRFDDNRGVASANETFRVTFPVPVGDADTNQGVAKYDKTAGDSSLTNDQFAGLDSSMLGDDGMTVTRDLNLITRSVGSSELNKALGTSVIVEEAYGQSPDQTPINVSALSQGTQLISSRKDEDSGTIQSTADIDFSRPEIQKGLYDLEAVDYLTGQIDRHGGNVFINAETGEVRGIDNDLCFGTKPLSEAVTDQAIGAKAVGKPPLLYHEDTARKIEEMTPDDLRSTLRSVDSPTGGNQLSEKEIEASVQRLETMQRDITLARVEGRVVNQFDEHTFKQSVDQHRSVAGEPGFDGKYGATGNYVGRCDLELQAAKAKVEQGLPGFEVSTPKPIETDSFRSNLQESRAKVEEARKAALADPSEPIKTATEKVDRLTQRTQEARRAVDTKLAEGADFRNRDIAVQEKLIERKATDAKTLEDLRYSTAPLTKEQATLARTVAGLHATEGQQLSPDDKRKLPEAIKKLNNGVSEAQNKIDQINNTFLKTAESEISELRNANSELATAKKEQQTAINQDPRVLAEQEKLDSHVNLQKESLKRAANNPWQASEPPKAGSQSVRESLIGNSRKPPQAGTRVGHEGQGQDSEPKAGRVGSLREKFEKLSKSNQNTTKVEPSQTKLKH